MAKQQREVWKQGLLYGEQYTWGTVVNWQSKGELGGPGDLVIQDRIVANTQRSTGTNLADFLGTKVPAILVLISR